MAASNQEDKPFVLRLLFRHFTQAVECTNQIQQIKGTFHILASVNIVKIIHSDSKFTLYCIPLKGDMWEKYQNLAQSSAQHTTATKH